MKSLDVLTIFRAIGEEVLKWVLFLIFMVLSLTAFMVSPLWAGEEGLRIAGAKTLQSITMLAAQEFTEKYQTWNTVDPTLPSTPIVIQTASGGSSAGINAVIEGTVQIGLIARPLKEKEKQELGEHQVILVGFDAIVIATHRKNPLVDVKKGFTVEELGVLFSGNKRTYRDWEPSLPDREIQLLGRDRGTGSSGMVEELILRGKPFAHNLKEFSSQQDLFKELLTNRQAIAFISAGFARQNASLFVFTVDGIAATDDTIRQGRYPLARPEAMLVKGKPELRVQKFIDYMLTEGQKLMAVHHVLPIPAGTGL